MERKNIRRIEVSTLQEWHDALDALFSKNWHWLSGPNTYHDDYFEIEKARILYFYATDPSHKQIMRGGAVDPYILGHEIKISEI